VKSCFSGEVPLSAFAVLAVFVVSILKDNHEDREEIQGFGCGTRLFCSSAVRLLVVDSGTNCARVLF
jgi:hypothetical protein